MAPAAHAPVKRATYDGSRPRFQSLDAWLNVYGNAEYAIYKRDAAPNVLSYEDWSQSEHVLGPFLWYTTLDIWEEDSSSGEESDAEAPVFTSHTLTKQQPKKSAMANGHGKRGTAKSSPIITQSKSEDAAAAAKRKRKPKKPYLSEDIVVSDVSDEVEESSPVAGASPSVATVPTSPANGRRKSGGRRKKHYLSAEIISPEDEDEESMAANGIVATTANSYEPSAPESPAPVAAKLSETPKGKPGRKPKKKSFVSQAILSKDDDEQIGAAPADAASTPKNAAASPDGPGSSSRRGLRTRTPAQQRPYFHNAQVFDELVSDKPETETGAEPSPPRPKQKLRLTGLAQVSFPDLDKERQKAEEETMLISRNDDEEAEKVDDEAMRDPEESQPPRKAHYKGKGRAWKKTSDDEDQDYKSPVKVKTNQPTRKLGRRKSSQTAPENEEPAIQQQEDEKDKEQIDPAVQSPTPKGNKKTRKPRKISHLSEEFVRDDSDTAPEENKQSKANIEPEKAQSLVPTTPAQVIPKKGRGRPRKSDQGSVPKDKKQKPTLANHGASLERENEVLPEKRTPKEPASSSKKNSKQKLLVTDQPPSRDANGASPAPEALSNIDQEKGKLPSRKSATPTQNPISARKLPSHGGSPSPPSPRNKNKVPEISAEVISLLKSDREDGKGPEAIPAEPSSRRTERAHTSDLLALDDSGRAVTLSDASAPSASQPDGARTESA